MSKETNLGLTESARYRKQEISKTVYEENLSSDAVTETTALLGKAVDSYTNADNKTITKPDVGVSNDSCSNTVAQSELVQTSSFWLADTCSHVKRKDTTSRSDKKVPFISGCCVMPDGHIVLCDHQNFKIKLLTEDLLVKYELRLAEQPYDAAAVDENVAIVSIPKLCLLAFVVIKPGVKIDCEIKVGHKCMGVAVNDQYIYVTIADAGKVVNIRYRGNTVVRQAFYGIKIYSIEGSLLGKIEHAGTDLLSKVCVSEDGSKIYYAGGQDIDAFVTCVTPDGYGVFRYSDDKLTCPVGLALDENENVIVGDCVTNYIHVINEDGVNRKYLMRDSSVPDKTAVLCYDNFASILLVCEGQIVHMLMLKTRRTEEIRDTEIVRGLKERQENVTDQGEAEGTESDTDLNSMNLSSTKKANKKLKKDIGYKFCIIF